MSNDNSHDNPVIGSLSAAEGRGVIRLDRRYDTSIDDLWSALVDPDRLARWYGTVAGELRPGGTFQTRLEAADLDGTGRVETCEPPRRLVVPTRETDESWQRGQGPAPFDATVEATLTAEGEGTRLVIEVRGLPLERIASYGGGWQIQSEYLAAHLTGEHLPEVGPRWSALVAGYEQLASQLGEVGP